MNLIKVSFIEMKIERLGNYISEISERNRNGEDLPVFSVTNTEGFVRSDEYFGKQVYSKNLSTYKIVRHGFFAFNPSRANVGSIDFLKNEKGALVSPLYTVFCCDEQIDQAFLLLFLKSDLGLHQIKSKSRGSVRDILTFEHLGNLKIPLPNIPTQRRIAALLYRVEGLIRRRRESLQLLDELERSVFWEMFGDPAINPKELPRKKLPRFYLNEKEGARCGPFGSALKKEDFQETGIPVWNMDNITESGEFIDSPRMFIGEDKYRQLKNFETKQGDIIISRAGTVGKMAVVRSKYERSLISTNLIRLRLNDQLSPDFFVFLMVHFGNRVKRLKAGSEGSLTHMSTDILSKIEFPYPSPKQQCDFLEILQTLKFFQEKQLESLSDLQALYHSLAHRAFRNELDLSGISNAELLAWQLAETPLGDLKETFQTASETLRESVKPTVEALQKASEAIRESAKSVTETLQKAQEGMAESISGVADSPYLKFYGVWKHFHETGASFTFQELHNRATGLFSDENPAVDFEQLKKVLFHALAQGDLRQSFDTDKRQIVFRTQPLALETT